MGSWPRSLSIFVRIQRIARGHVRTQASNRRAGLAQVEAGTAHVVTAALVRRRFSRRSRLSLLGSGGAVGVRSGERHTVSFARIGLQHEDDRGGDPGQLHDAAQDRPEGGPAAGCGCGSCFAAAGPGASSATAGGGGGRVPAGFASDGFWFASFMAVRPGAPPMPGSCAGTWDAMCFRTWRTHRVPKSADPK